MSETTVNRMISMHATDKPFHIDKRMVYEAYKAVKSNRGASGVDEQSIEQFEADLSKNLYKIWNRMSSGSYFPPPVRAVSIPKKSGGERILGVPTVADRVAQTAVKQVKVAQGAYGARRRNYNCAKPRYAPGRSGQPNFSQSFYALHV
jgi:RNA-directed DNA polymerase